MECMDRNDVRTIWFENGHNASLSVFVCYCVCVLLLHFFLYGYQIVGFGYIFCFFGFDLATKIQRSEGPKVSKRNT